MKPYIAVLATVGCCYLGAFIGLQFEGRAPRYFHIAYSAAIENQQIRGCIWFKMKSFPSKEWIKMQVLSGDKMVKYRPENVVIENIFEFKNKEDYDAFLYTKYDFEKDFDKINAESDSAIKSSK